MHTMEGTVLLDDSQVNEAATLLADVFQHDPMMQYLYAGVPNMRERSLPFYRAALRMGTLYGEVHTTSELDGVAIWIKPGNTDFSFGQMLRSGFFTAILRTGFRPFSRFMKSANTILPLEKQAISGPRWALMFVAIRPELQGRGIGRKLLEPILVRAAADGIPCYLESTNERNLTFYQRLGYRTVVEADIPDGGPHVWVMLRDPEQPL
ncbi:MAG: GNAT family N-acetyltransferase [Chloroflexi bacterium]|nr:GNAT family N-acetyltransferase [Chloroflexota bacterium]